ncbi:restriction endonuclease [Streptomyces sp. NPDC088348]|uniref:restriction endonuclease n=1 Tax=Streptomyces sp. NPDC088348 TaxID=3365853 RepID=UPI0037FC8C03
MTSTQRRPRTRRIPRRAPARRRPASSRRRRGLRRIHWAWPVTVVVVILAAVREWPVQSVLVAVLLAAAGITWAARRHPLRLARFFHHGPRLPRPGEWTIRKFYALAPGQFEQAIADLALRDPGVRRATVEGGTDDKTMDVRVALHNGQHVQVQCKRYAATKAVDANTVYAVNGTYRSNGCHLAVIVTTSRFTASAQAFAAQEGVRLCDGPGLERWANGGPAPWS